MLVTGHPNTVIHNQLVYIRLADLGWDVSIVVPNRWADDYTPDGYTPQCLEGFYGRFGRARIVKPGDIQKHTYVSPLTRWIREPHRPDVIFLEHEAFSVSALQWGQLAWRYGIPWGVQGDENLDRPLPWPAHVIRALTIPRLDFIAARSPGGTEMLRWWGATAPADVVPHTIPEWDLPPRTDDRPFTVGFAGRLIEQKGIRDLIAALRRLDFPFRFLVAGNGPLRDEIAAADLPHGTVEMVPPGQRPDDLPGWYAQMDVLVLPSRTMPTWAEQYGKVLAEALLCGTPVVGSSSGAIPWVIELTQGGRVFPEGDDAALAKVLSELHADPALRAQLAETGRANVVEHLLPRAAAKKLDVLMRDAIARGPSARLLSRRPPKAQRPVPTALSS